MSFVFVYNFEVGVEKSSEETHALNRQMSASLNEFAQQVTNDGPITPLAPTGNADLDEGLRPIVDLVNDFKAALGRMEADISEVNQFDVLSPSVSMNPFLYRSPTSSKKFKSLSETLSCLAGLGLKNCAASVLLAISISFESNFVCISIHVCTPIWRNEDSLASDANLYVK
jgi:hypothetical protein